MLANNGTWVKGAGFAVATLAAGTPRSALVPGACLSVTVIGGDVRRLLGRTVRMLVVTAVVSGLIRVVRSVLARNAATTGADAVRTGSFDRWPAVPPAPGRSPSDH